MLSAATKIHLSTGRIGNREGQRWVETLSESINRIITIIVVIIIVINIFIVTITIVIIVLSMPSPANHSSMLATMLPTTCLTSCQSCLPTSPQVPSLFGPTTILPKCCPAKDILTRCCRPRTLFVTIHLAIAPVSRFPVGWTG